MSTAVKTTIGSLVNPTSLRDFYHLFQVLCNHNQIMYREEAKELIGEISHNHHYNVQKYLTGGALKPLEDVLNYFPPKEKVEPGDLSMGGKNYPLIHNVPFETVFPPPPPKSNGVLILTKEIFDKADKRSLSRSEWVVLESFIAAGGFGWAAALVVQNRLWGPVERPIDTLRSALDKLGCDYKAYLERRQADSIYQFGQYN